MSNPIPILFFSDAVSASTGLARITRDIATRVHEFLPDKFRVGAIGYGGSGSSKYHFPQYSWTMNNEWVIHDLPEIWEDFAGDEPGIFMSVYDPHRMLWLARPETCSDRRVRSFLETKPFKKWGYFPIDATGPQDRLSCMLKECLIGYDRVLCYSAWSKQIVENTLGAKESKQRDLTWLPHGIDTNVFHRYSKVDYRRIFSEMAVGKKVEIEPDEFLVGIVATNQARKDYGLGLATCAEIAKERKLRLWIHTDALDRYWSIPYLLSDFGLSRGNFISLDNHPDEVMARLYSACDVTLGIGAGEGFGYPIFESLACGTPCVHGNYGGAPEHLPPELLVEPKAYRYEGVYGSVRPVYDPKDWAKKVLAAPQAKFPEYLGWNVNVRKWKEWFLKGVLCQPA